MDVLCVGMYRSGSTWQYDVVSRLLERHRGGRRLGFVTGAEYASLRGQGAGGWRYDSSRVGSWILEEPVHFFDMLMWWFEELGDPHLVHGFGSAKPGRGSGMYDNFSAVLRWPGGSYGVVTQSLAGFEHHHVVEVVGREGAIRAWCGNGTTGGER